MPLSVINTLYNMKMFLALKKEKKKRKRNRVNQLQHLVPYWLDIQPLNSTMIFYISVILNSICISL